MSGIVLHSGWLTKCSGSHKNWKRRFFRLLARSHSTPPRLSYYRNEVSTEPLGNIAIERCRPIQPATSPVARKYCIIAETPSRTYELIAETAEDLDAWMHHIKSVQNPSVAPPGTDERHCICEGWLTKQGGRVKSWKRRWFMLRDTFLLYFKSDKQATAIGHVDLTLSTAVYGAMQAQLPQFPFAFEIPTTERVYLFACSRREDLDYWLDGIYRALQQHRDREEREREQMQKRMERRTVECTQKSQTARLSDLEAEILMLGGQQRGSVMTLSESSMPRLNSLAHALSSGTGSDTDEDESAGAYSAAYGSRPMPSPGAGAAPPPPLSGTSSSRRTSAVHTYETRPAYEPAYDEASSTYSDASFHPLLAPPTRPPPNTPGNDDVDAEATLQREKNDARDYDYGDPRYYAKIDVDRAMKHQSAHFPQYDEEFDHDEEEDDDTVSLAPSTSTSIHLSSAAPPPPPARRVIPRPPEERLVDTPRNTGQPRSSDLYAYQRQQHKLKQEAQATGSPAHDGDDVYVEVDPVADEGDYGSVHGGSDYDYADPSNAAPAPAPAPSRNKPMPKQQSLRVIAESAPSPPQRSSSFVTTARTNLSSAKPPPALPPSRRR